MLVIASIFRLNRVVLLVPVVSEPWLMFAMLSPSVSSPAAAFAALTRSRRQHCCFQRCCALCAIGQPYCSAKATGPSRRGLKHHFGSTSTAVVASSSRLLHHRRQVFLLVFLGGPAGLQSAQEGVEFLGIPSCRIGDFHM